MARYTLAAFQPFLHLELTEPRYNEPDILVHHAQFWRRETVFDNFLQTYNTFQESGVPSPLVKTLHLFDFLSEGMVQQADRSLSERAELDLAELAQRIRDGRPLEYAIGKARFVGLEFTVTPDTLIPREETELLVKVALDYIGKAQENQDIPTVVDVGTGCGNIAVSLAIHASDISVLASDISPTAIEIARENVLVHGVGDRVRLFCGDLFAPIRDAGYEDKIDLVVCNPPYIPTASLGKLDPVIIDNEPRIALDAGPYGINIFRRLVQDSLLMLKPGGILAFEIGAGQDTLVTRLLRRSRGYSEIKHHHEGTQVRVVSAIKAKEPFSEGREL